MLQQVMETLLAETRASRTTLRLDRDDAVFPVVAEALAPGISSIAGATEIDLRNAPTVIDLVRERRVLVQDDVETAEPRAPQELIELYGVRAQMLGPVVRDDALAGIISVHDCRGRRTWSAADVENLRFAVHSVEARLTRDEG